MMGRKLMVLLFIATGYFESNSQSHLSSAEKKIYTSSKSFRKNVGQWDKHIKYQALQGHKNIWLMDNGLSFGMSKTTPFDMEKLKGLTEKEVKEKNLNINPKIEYFVWNVLFEGMNKNVRIEDYNLTRGKYNYFNEYTGSQGAIRVPETNKVKYKNLYNGIDLEFLVENGKNKYNFILNSTSSKGDIKLKYQGINKLEVNKKGQLLIHTDKGIFKESAPVSYLISENGITKKVDVKYKQYDASTIGYDFDFNINENETLIIDPIYLDWATYFTGKKSSLNWSWTWITDVDIDQNDKAYCMGITTDKFPTKPGVYDKTINGGYDVFLCRMKKDGSDIDYFTYIGGSSSDYSYGMTATDDGKIYILGTTNSTNFPTTKGSLFEKKQNGSNNNFILGINQTGSKLIYSTYLCGSGNTWWNSTALDVTEKGEVVLALNNGGSCFAETDKIKFTQNNIIVGQSPKLIKINAKGSKLLKATTFGGDGTDNINGIFINSKNEIYFCGNTTSRNLYTHFGANFFGKQDAIMVKIDSNWTKSLMLKYVGGKETDNLTSIYGNGKYIWAGGISNSNRLPRVNNSFPGGNSNFALKMTENGMRIFWTTYLSGGNWFSGAFNRQSITANVKGQAYLVGNTNDKNFYTTKDAFQRKLKGFNDAFIVKLSDKGKVLYGSYYGGSGWDYFYGTQAKKIGCVTYIVAGGYTTSKNFRTTKGSWIPKFKSNGWFANSGAIIKLRDTLKVADINIGNNKTITQCNKIYRFLDAKNPGAKYKWQDGDTNKIYPVYGPGKFWVNATYGCEVKSDTVSFILKFGPQKINLGKDTIMCGKFNLNLDAKNDTIKERTYLWSTGESTQKIDIDSTGKIWVKVSTKRCGSKTDTINITKIKYINTDIGADTTYCQLFKHTLNVKSDSATYKWNTGDSTAQIEVDKEGTYNVLIRNFCGATIEEIIIKRDSLPHQTALQDSLFCDSVKHTITINGQPRSTRFRWNTGDSTATIKLHKADKYSVLYSNICGVTKDSFEYTILKSPIAILPQDTQFCDNVNLTLINNSKNSTATWLPQNTLSDTLKINKIGKYFLKLNNKCADSYDSIEVFLVKSPTINLGKDSLFCDNINHTIKPTGTFENVNFKWNNGSTDTNLHITKAGNYVLTVKNVCKSVTGQVNYTFKNKPKAYLRKDTAYCNTFIPTKLNSINSGKIGINYIWNTGSNTPQITAKKPGLYWVKTYNECGTDSAGTNMILSQNPIVDLGTDTAFCGPLNYYLDAGTEGTIYNWLPTKETTSSIYAQDYGTYTVSVINQYGCKGTDNILIKNKCNLHLYVPTAFSPNKNGKNELFGPTTNDVLYIKFEIYNRWGEVVFSTNELDKQWDGTYQGKPCPQDTYMWRVFYRGQRNQKSKSGSVTLMR